MHTSQALVVSSLLSLLAGCSLTGPRCGAEAWGGGEFTITFDGAVQGTVTRPGMSQEELDRWMDSDFHWVDVDSHYFNDGETGALFFEGVGTTEMESFAASVELGDELTGCDDADWMGVRFGNDAFATVNLVSADGGIVFDSTTQNFEYSGGRVGSGSSDGDVQYFEGVCTEEGDRVSITVEWAMDSDVTVRDVQSDCSGYWF